MNSCDVVIWRFAIYYGLIIIYGRGFDLQGLWPAFVLAVLLYRQPLDQLNYCSILSLAASLMYIMDWNVWYQSWPIPTICGALVGKFLDHLLAL